MRRFGRSLMREYQLSVRMETEEHADVCLTLYMHYDSFTCCVPPTVSPTVPACNGNCIEQLNGFTISRSGRIRSQLAVM